MSHESHRPILYNRLGIGETLHLGGTGLKYEDGRIKASSHLEIGDIVRIRGLDVIKSSLGSSRVRVVKTSDDLNDAIVNTQPYEVLLLEDGVHMISESLTDDEGWPNHPLSIVNFGGATVRFDTSSQDVSWGDKNRVLSSGRGTTFYNLVFDTSGTDYGAWIYGGLLWTFRNCCFSGQVHCITNSSEWIACRFSTSGTVLVVPMMSNRPIRCLSVAISFPVLPRWSVMIA